MSATKCSHRKIIQKYITFVLPDQKEKKNPGRIILCVIFACEQVN